MKKIYLTIIIISVLAVLFSTIFFPAYLSYKSSCDKIEFEEKYSDKYYVAGKVTISTNEEGKQESELFLLDEDNIPIKKHEECHINQFEKERLYSCNRPILKWINEVECYSIERFWKIKLLF